MEKARQYSALNMSCDHNLTVQRGVDGRVCLCLPAHCSMVTVQKIGGYAISCLTSESFRQHYTQFALEPFENAEFLDTADSREVDIALSKGQGGKDRSVPSQKRGRQQEWYKDYWLLQLRHLWRLSLFRVAKIGLYPTSRRMQPCISKSITTSFLTSINSFGRAFGPVLFAPSAVGGAHG